MNQSEYEKGEVKINAIHKPYLSDAEFNAACLNSQDLMTAWEREHGREINTATALEIYDRCLESEIS